MRARDADLGTLWEGAMPTTTDNSPLGDYLTKDELARELLVAAG